MGDEWEGTWGDPERWQETVRQREAAPPAATGFSLSRRSKLILGVAALAVVSGFMSTISWGRDDEPSYAFRSLREDGVTPIGFDPCVALGVVVNPRTGPQNAVALVERAVEHLADASGLEIAVRGTDSMLPIVGSENAREPRGAAILVSWSDPDEVEDLRGDVAGVGGSWFWRGHGNMDRYAYGNAVLDGPQLAKLSEPAVVAVIMHEIGHVIGLDHVDDRGELMYPTALRTELGPGDRQGLAKLGSLSCAGGRLRTGP